MTLMEYLRAEEVPPHAVCLALHTLEETRLLTAQDHGSICPDFLETHIFELGYGTATPRGCDRS